MPYTGINRRRFLGLLGSAAAAATVPGTGYAAANRKPNFVFIIMDDLGWTDLGYAGSKYYETPNIDRLASQGMVFTDAYSNAPNCAPTRACIISGQYGPRHGVYTVGTAERGSAKYRKLIPTANTESLRSDIVTIAEALKPAGYISACIGKWHLGNKPGCSPTDQGFDVAFDRGQAGYGGGHFSATARKSKIDDPKGEYLTDRLTDEAIEFVEGNRDKPFLLYLAHHAVHTPHQAKQKLIEKYQAKLSVGGHNNPVYAAMIESVDENIGRLAAKLDELGLAENTVLIFYSDNGGVGGYQEWGVPAGAATSNAPLHGGKGMLYEGGIRVPMFVRWPGHVKAGSQCDTPVIGMDFYPTFLELAGAEKPNQLLDGESLVPLLEQTGTLKRDALFWHFPCYLEGGAAAWRTTPAAAIRQGDFKLHEFFEDNHIELYNLKDDIGERTNLAEKMPDQARELHQRLVEWRNSVNAPVPTQLNPDYDPQAKP